MINLVDNRIHFIFLIYFCSIQYTIKLFTSSHSPFMRTLNWTMCCLHVNFHPNADTKVTCVKSWTDFKLRCDLAFLADFMHFFESLSLYCHLNRIIMLPKCLTYLIFTLFMTKIRREHTDDKLKDNQHHICTCMSTKSFVRVSSSFNKRTKITRVFTYSNETNHNAAVE